MNLDNMLKQQQRPAALPCPALTALSFGQDAQPVQNRVENKTQPTLICGDETTVQVDGMHTATSASSSDHLAVVEVCQSPTSTLPVDSLQVQVKRYLQETTVSFEKQSLDSADVLVNWHGWKPFLRPGSVAVASKNVLAQHVENIQLEFEVPMPASGTQVLGSPGELPLWRAHLSVHVFRLCQLEMESEFTDQDDADTVAYNSWVLPCKQFQGLWQR